MRRKAAAPGFGTPYCEVTLETCQEGGEEEPILSQASSAGSIVAEDQDAAVTEAAPEAPEVPEAEPAAEAPAETAVAQPAQYPEEKEYTVGLFQAYCDDKQAVIKTRNIGDKQVCKIKADNAGFNKNANNAVDIFWDETLQKHGIIVTSRNACRNWAAAEGQGCTRGKSCRYFHFAPGDLVDNFIGKNPRKIGDIPVSLAGHQRAKEYRWSQEDTQKIEEKETELLKSYVAAALQKEKKTKSFEQKQEEAIAKAIAKHRKLHEDSDSDTEQESDSGSDSGGLRAPPTKRKRKAKAGKTASKSKKARRKSKK